MIKIQAGNLTFFCDTAREAAELASLLGVKTQKDEKHFYSIPKQVEDTTASEKHDVKVFINVIKRFAETQVSSGTLAQALNLESVNGLGPRLNSIAKRFEAVYHRPFEHVIERVGPPGKYGHWKINKEILEKID